MPFTLEAFCRTRPYLYHLTARANVPRITRTRRLHTARQLMEEGGRLDLLRTRRKAIEPVTIAGEEVLIRDQAPLHEGNMELEAGWSFGDLIELLNSRVFFWPGRAGGPVPSGVRHWRRYEAERPFLLRVPTQSLLEANPHTEPEFCRYNSGSPRCNQGRRSPRTSRTFICSADVDFSRTKVVEVTFPAAVTLPAETEMAQGPVGPWLSLA